MADQPQSPFGDISMIRDILMGQQMTEYNGRFQELENTLHKMAEQFDQKLAALEKEHAEQRKQMQEANAKRFEKLESLLQTKIDSLDKKLEKVSRDDKHLLGQMLTKMGAQLTKENS